MSLRHQLIVLLAITAISVASVSGSTDDRIVGTLVVVVPVKEGLVTCADKRLFHVGTGTYTDNNIKIREVSDSALFIATNTVGFYDRRKKRPVFDAFDVVAKYTARRRFDDSRDFWTGIKAEIQKELRKYFSSHEFSEWPETDRANNNLLFNLMFYTVNGGRPRGHTLQVFYEKKRTPVVNIVGPTSEVIRTPKLNGKGRELMSYLDRNPSIASDPAILRFDGGRFRAQSTSIDDAIAFSRTLFRLANTGLPQAQVSATFDCALLSVRDGFRWIEGGPTVLGKANDLMGDAFGRDLRISLTTRHPTP